MRNIYEVIRQKEAEIQQLQKDLEALRLAARLLTDEVKADVEPAKAMRMTASVSPIKTDTEIVLPAAPRRQFP
jgi:hypothetical protein